MHAQFLLALDASNRAVMAGTDGIAAGLASEARDSLDLVQRDAESLRPLLDALDYAAELAILGELSARLTEYRAADQQVLELALDSTNLKAQGLSFGAAQDAAESFRVALESVAGAASGADWQLQALAAQAVAALRGIQVLQAPHIAEADDAEMTRLEQRMLAMEQAIAASLDEIATRASSDSEQALLRARSALEEFFTLHAEILALSRRNSNVQALALSLGHKRTLAASCEERLRALQSALADRDLGPTR